MVIDISVCLLQITINEMLLNRISLYIIIGILRCNWLIVYLLMRICWDRSMLRILFFTFSPGVSRRINFMSILRHHIFDLLRCKLIFNGYIFFQSTPTCICNFIAIKSLTELFHILKINWGHPKTNSSSLFG